MISTGSIGGDILAFISLMVIGVSLLLYIMDKLTRWWGG